MGSGPGIYIYTYGVFFFWFCNPQIWGRWDPVWRAVFWKRGGSTTNYSGFLLTFLWTTLVLLLMDLCISLWELATKNLGKSLKKQGDSSPQVMAQPPHGAVFPHVWGRWIRDGGGDIQEIDCDKMLRYTVLIVEWWTPWCFSVFCFVNRLSNFRATGESPCLLPWSVIPFPWVKVVWLQQQADSVVAAFLSHGYSWL